MRKLHYCTNYWHYLMGDFICKIYGYILLADCRFLSGPILLKKQENV